MGGVPHPTERRRWVDGRAFGPSRTGGFPPPETGGFILGTVEQLISLPAKVAPAQEFAGDGHPDQCVDQVMEYDQSRAAGRHPDHGGGRRMPLSARVKEGKLRCPGLRLPQGCGFDRSAVPTALVSGLGTHDSQLTQAAVVATFRPCASRPSLPESGTGAPGAIRPYPVERI